MQVNAIKTTLSFVRLKLRIFKELHCTRSLVLKLMLSRINSPTHKSLFVCWLLKQIYLCIYLFIYLFISFGHTKDIQRYDKQ